MGACDVRHLDERCGDLIDRLTGPMKFRLVLQPVMAAFFAIRSGLEDARAGKPPTSANAGGRALTAEMQLSV
jgi:hypothetical protein